MNHYQIEIAISNVYEVEVLAEDLDQAEDIASHIDPTGTTESVRFVEVRRDITDTAEQTIEELLENLTGLVFEVCPTGGGCHALEAQTKLGHLQIVEAESAQAPTSASDVVSVVYVDPFQTKHLGTFKFSELLMNGYAIAQIIQTVTNLEDTQTTCPECLQLVSDCKNNSAETEQLVKALTVLRMTSQPFYSRFIETVLDGYLTHSVSRCNQNSRA